MNFKIPQYTVWEGSLHCCTVARTQLYVFIKRESSETEALELVEHDDTEELIHNIHIDHHKYPQPLTSAPASHTH